MYRTPDRPDEDNPKRGERGMSSVAMRARKGKKESDQPEPTGREKERSSAEEKTPRPQERPEGEQTMRKGIYLSALIWVEGDWPAARDFTAPAKAATKDALSRAFEGDQDGLTLRLKRLEVRNDVEDDGEGEEATGKKDAKFEF